MLENTKLYIKNTACISSLEIVQSNDTFELMDTSSANYKDRFVIEPNYRDFLGSSIIRRGAKYMKNGLYTALKCLEEFNNEVKGIIVGTGVGSFLYTEKFLLEMIDKNEENLSPNTFLQSMSSTISGNIAILTKCNGYNMTYVNRGISFENALVDAGLHCNKDNSQLMLVGATDEVTESYSKFVRETNYLSTSNKETELGLGEGATFMLVSGEGEEGNVCIKAVEVLFMPSPEEINNRVKHVLDKNDVTIDLVLTTRNIQSILKHVDKVPCIFYKDYVGEYPTVSSFAVWVSEKILSTQHIPQIFKTNVKKDQTLRNILIINQYKNNTSILLVSK